MGQHPLTAAHYRWLAIWCLVALAIRLLGLTLKPAWMDEVATAIYSLGNSSYLLPLDQTVDLGAMLAPLRPRPDATL
ncbi:MAG: glycosyltransferase, partial [Cyanobacteria bacterium]|nr:glycosyltransferase [Cyanobacteriota bacterium]